MLHIHSFPPIATADAHTLILGSMPGVLSLQHQQYYAHPRNAFWSIMGELLGFDPQTPYQQRTAALLNARIALWDVLQSCQRKGSLDADIDKTSSVPNDFGKFFAKHPHIRRIFFNGATAETIFRKQVLPALHDDGRLQLTRLPSTSPAHAGLSIREKLISWRAVADGR
jgi:hypoxanthine-DNA glycosylase